MKKQYVVVAVFVLSVLVVGFLAFLCLSLAPFNGSFPTPTPTQTPPQPLHRLIAYQRQRLLRQMVPQSTPTK